MKIALYSSVADKVLFDRVGFYRDDIIALGLRGDDVLATNSLKELLHFAPQLIVTYFYSKSILTALAGRLTGARVLFTGGADQISPACERGCSLLKHRVLAFICLLLAHRILLSCTDDMINFRKLCFGLSSLEIKLEHVNHVVIPSPDSKLIQSLSNSRFDAFTICWMGAIGNVRRKGVDRAVKLIGLLRHLGLNAKLEIAGTDGPGRVLVEEIIRDLDLEQHVRLLGEISEQEKNDRLANNNVYLQLSDHEGFGVAAAEAFFSGMVVVHTNKGGLRDVIGDKGLVLNADVIDSEDIQSLELFCKEFADYEIDYSYLANNIKNYSTKMRSDAFLGGVNVCV